MRNFNRNKGTQNWKAQGEYKKKEFKPRPQPEGLQVFVREGEDISKALRKLKKKMERANILQELRDRQFYQKPSEKRRKAKKAGIARWKKKQRENELSR
jgi:small subunit ribosomal protein S21